MLTLGIAIVVIGFSFSFLVVKSITDQLGNGTTTGILSLEPGQTIVGYVDKKEEQHPISIWIKRESTAASLTVELIGPSGQSLGRLEEADHSNHIFLSSDSSELGRYNFTIENSGETRTPLAFTFGYIRNANSAEDVASIYIYSGFTAMLGLAGIPVAAIGGFLMIKDWRKKRQSRPQST